MKNFLFAVLFMTATFAHAQTTWKVDKSHSSINFSVTHMLISETTGHFQDFDITAISNDQLTDPKVSVTIDASTINTNMKMRDDHLKADDFFDVANHPEITFESTGYEQKENGKFSLTGNITLKGKTLPITFEGKLNGIVDNPRSKSKVAGLKLTSSILRSDFGIGAKGGSIGDEVTITINLEMTPEK